MDMFYCLMVCKLHSTQYYTHMSLKLSFIIELMFINIKLTKYDGYKSIFKYEEIDNRSVAQ